MNLIKTFPGIIPLVLLFACSNPAKEVQSAAVDKAAGAATNQAAAPEPEGRSFAFGPGSSAIAFTGSKITRSHLGGFTNFAGEFKVANGTLADSGNKVLIDLSSLYSDDPRLTSHLKSPDFFGVAQNPTATFISTSVKKQETNSLVTGDLALHGTTKSISFPAKIVVSDDAVTVTGIFTINRSDFGIKYPGMANDLIREKVILRLNVKSTPGRADFAALEQVAKARAATVQPMPGPGGGGMRPGPGGPRPGGGPRPPGGGPPPQ